MGCPRDGGPMTTMRLEDFGVRESMSPQDRKKEYARQCKALDPDLRAAYWLSVLRNDPGVAKITGFKVSRKTRKEVDRDG